MDSNFVTFPVNLQWDAKRKRWILTRPINKWQSLTKSMDIEQSPNYGIITGERSQITILEFSKQTAVDLFPEHLFEAFMFDLPPSKVIRYYFQYEEKLESIYNIIRGLSVINDNRFIIVGKLYKTMRKREIAPMPQEVLEKLIKLQKEHNAVPIAQSFYDLVAPLPDKWFNQRDYFVKIVHAIRNTLMTEETRAATIKKILVDKFAYYDEHLVLPEFETIMNSTERRFGVPALSKLIKADSPEVYKDWHDKWKARKKIAPPKQIKTRFRYKYGASATLADIKTVQRGITAKKLLEMNAQFTASKHNICKDCRNKHLVGCCKQYRRTNRVISTYIANIELY